MSQLRLETMTVPAAGLGGENPLPPLVAIAEPNVKYEADPSIPDEDRCRLGFGVRAPILPYRLQDGYDRRRRPRALRVAVLENEFLRATFAPELGGRLWSLFHKPTQRELLSVNPVFQPANLAIRDAWFSGGVEWNMSMVGHHPFTCSPLFAGRLRDPRGHDILRFYEWERGRGLLFQIDASLPPGSRFLLVRVRLVNPNNVEIPTYWWSNIAVPEAPGHRVLVPADWAVSFSYTGPLSRIPIPVPDRGNDLRDVTYPTNLPSARDFFFRIADGRRAWVASLDAQGRGLIQASTDRLKGRKLFVWGMSPGGRTWQTFLAEPGTAYIEIQAGLGRTQTECVPMPARADWSWLEAYGLMEADAAAAHGSDWSRATGDVEARLEAQLSRAWMDAELERTADLADQPPEELFQHGSGWGALEERRRERAGEPRMARASTPFPASGLGPEQEPWVALLERGRLPAGDPARPPVSWMIQETWRELLETSVKQPSNGSSADDSGYLAWLHLGVMHFTAHRLDEARSAWERSFALLPSAWALRCLAVLARHEKRLDEAAALLTRACAMLPDQLHLALECANALHEAGRPADLARFFAGLPEPIRANDRMLLQALWAWLQTSDLDSARRTLEGDLEIVGLREGETSITELWFSYHEQRLARAEGVAIDDALRKRVRRECPAPAKYDFRMAASQG
ncbi:MAG: DUF5107 domain-containing protein [Planctomycetota bacterium]|nr:DUF5107 domain-containing protein [Planctomycetota bacterium]